MPGRFMQVGEVSVWSLGEDRFRVEAPGGKHLVSGHDQAVELAHKLAGV